MNLPRPLRAAVYQTFYRLPHGLRRQIVRVFVQKYVVGAVIMLRDAESPDRILLLRQPPDRGWGLPAGLLNRREPPATGGARELAEETGVRLTAADLRPAVPSAVVHSGGWVDVVFEAAVPASTTPLSVDGAEVLEAAWHSVDDLPKLTHAAARLLGNYGIGPCAAAQDSSPELLAAASTPDADGTATGSTAHTTTGNTPPVDAAAAPRTPTDPTGGEARTTGGQAAP